MNLWIHRLAGKVVHSLPIWNESIQKLLTTSNYFKINTKAAFFLFSLELDHTELPSSSAGNTKSWQTVTSVELVYGLMTDFPSLSAQIHTQDSLSHRGSEEELAFLLTLQIAALWATTPALCCKLPHPRPTWPYPLGGSECSPFVKKTQYISFLQSWWHFLVFQTLLANCY